jgi:hypothetical protein
MKTTTIKEKTMKAFKVYHTRNWALNTKLHFIDSPDYVEKCAPEFKDGYKPFKSNYKHVANVTCEEYGQTFQLTNHIEKSWWENEGVELIEESRSTSVGDLVEDLNGKLWMVAGIGFMEVEWSNDDDPHEVYVDDYGSYIVPKKMEGNILLMGNKLAVENGDDVKLFKVSPSMKDEVNEYLKLYNIEVSESQKANFPWIK